jgi:hypothetical protein
LTTRRFVVLAVKQVVVEVCLRIMRLGVEKLLK